MRENVAYNSYNHIPWQRIEHVQYRLVTERGVLSWPRWDVASGQEEARLNGMCSTRIGPGRDECWVEVPVNSYRHGSKKERGEKRTFYLPLLPHRAKIRRN